LAGKERIAGRDGLAEDLDRFDLGAIGPDQ